ncbi:peptidylprolyl isomerase [Pyxidicoccus caerfyrddinensis]|uniref:peptidylprolyl isomerase n=1 Tax=Pyxidicoccus caerfyrddinensis TaxID=2709663 RepID=UPI0013DCCAB3|nr:peptidylprolyl isomerase [Pyxidicoccus caerfyrddinensis]
MSPPVPLLLSESFTTMNRSPRPMSLISTLANAAPRLVLTLALLALAACNDPKVVAEVGKRKVTKADVAAWLDSRSVREQAAPSDALDALVTRSLLAEEARRSGLLEDDAVKARLAAAEREVLAQQLLERRLASVTTEAALRKRYEDTREALARRQVRVRQIFVNVPSGEADAKARAQSRMNAIYARLVGGEDFEKVAREASEDPVSAARGGELGPLLEGQVDASFFDEAAKLGRGERSKPFTSIYGLHIVEAVEDVKTVVPSFEESRGRLEADARREAQTRLLTGLRERIDVKTYPERLGTAPAAGEAGGTDGGMRP